MALMQNGCGRCEYAFEADYVHIYNLYVLPQFRRQGHARRLLQSAIDAIRARGYTGEIKVVALPTEDNVDVERLRLFYVGMGLSVFAYYG